MSEGESINVLDKNVWNTKQFYCTVAFAVCAVWFLTGFVSRIASNEKNISTSKIRIEENKNGITENAKEIKREIYNNQQLTYRLNSKQEKYLEEMRAGFEKKYDTYREELTELKLHIVKTDSNQEYIIKILEEMRVKNKGGE